MFALLDENNKVLQIEDKDFPVSKLWTWKDVSRYPEGSIKPGYVLVGDEFEPPTVVVPVVKLSSSDILIVAITNFCLGTLAKEDFVLIVESNKWYKKVVDSMDKEKPWTTLTTNDA